VGIFRGLYNGFLAPFRGGLYVARQGLWRFLVLPILVNLALAAGALWAAATFWREELSQNLTSSPVLGWIFLVVVTALGGVVVFVVLQPVLGAVFNDRLSERVEVKVRGSAPSAPFLASTGRALLHGLLKLFFYAIALTVGLVLTAITGIGSLAGVGLGVLFLAYDGFDYPLSRRNLGFGAKWAYLARRPGLTLGYGLGATLLYLVPLAFVVAPPFAAVGATLAFLEDDARKSKARVAPTTAATVATAVPASPEKTR
jgi:CysZ protein